MHFDKLTYAPIFDEYRSNVARRDLLLARQAHLQRTAKERRRRRLKDTGNEQDENLERCEAELTEVSKRFSRLRDEIATVAYLVAERYWPKFFIKGKRLQGDSTSVICPSSERDDCIQAAVIKVVAVAHRFDASRGSLFNYLTKVCQNEFLGVIRKVQQKEVNYIRHVESYYGREQEIEAELPPMEEEKLEVESPEWKARKPIGNYASFGDGDDSAVLRFNFKPKKQRKCDTPTMKKLLANRAG